MALSQSNAAWSPCYMVINWKGVGENPSHPEWFKWCYQLCHCKASICSVAQERWTCVYAQTHSNMFYPQLLVYLYLSLWIILFHKRSCQLFLAVALVLHRSWSERWSNVGIWYYFVLNAASGCKTWQTVCFWKIRARRSESAALYTCLLIR